MASGASKPTAFMLFILNMGLYFFMIIISSWIINHGIVRSRESGESDSLQAYICSLLKDWFFQAITDLCMHALPCVNVYAAAILTIPARIFPIYFPMGNLATGFFIILSLLAGVVGTSSITGLYNLFLWNAPSIHATYASSLASLSLTLLAMGLMLTLSLSFSVLRIFLLCFLLLSNSYPISIISSWCTQTYQAFSQCALQIRMQRDQHRLDRFSLGMFIVLFPCYVHVCITSNGVSVNPLEPP